MHTEMSTAMYSAIQIKKLYMGLLQNTVQEIIISLSNIRQTHAAKINKNRSMCSNRAANW